MFWKNYIVNEKSVVELHENRESVYKFPMIMVYTKFKFKGEKDWVVRRNSTIVVIFLAYISTRLLILF